MSWDEIVIEPSIHDRFPDNRLPDWYPEAVRHLRGNADHGRFGRYLYHYIRDEPEIQSILNIGTARGHSAVCAARALKESDRDGVVHTVDVIDPDTARNWHTGKHLDDDPARGQRLTMRELVARFHDPDDSDVPIRFITGDSADILDDWNGRPIDLVFHDGDHSYDRVAGDIARINETQEQIPIHVFDDCHLPVFTKDRPMADLGVLEPLLEVPKLGSLVRDRIRRYSVFQTQYPGLRRAVLEAMEGWRWDRIEVVLDDDHAPITVLEPP